MRSRKSSSPEQTTLDWDVPGLIAGVDEAGRGPLAGPVVAAAVILDDLNPIKGLADSKTLTPLRREKLFDEIRAKALCCSIAQASVEEIDELNILQATLLAMRRAVEGLRLKPAKVLAACDVTLIASGTATLEAALFKRPMVISYKVNWLSYLIMKPKQLQPWIGLPNILCREFVVPELLQSEATPHALADAVLQWLDAPQKVAALQQRFTALHTELQRDTPRLATDAIAKILRS